MTYLRLKRISDIMISFLGILILSPILLLTAFAIKIESKGPVLFKQDRIGSNGKVFKIWKFRSMKLGAEKGGVYEMKNDNRVTKVGRFIRKTSIDELPQLVNIIRGEMAIIGPRPVLTYHPWTFDKYSDEQKKRFSVRPGVTGWAQINGRKDIPWERRIQYDLEYVNKLSFMFDMKIFLKTIVKVFSMQDNVNTGETAKTKEPS